MVDEFVRKILYETTSMCKKCAMNLCCIEEKCPIFRIEKEVEKLGVKDENSK